jgi:hypothetical protein
VDDELLLLLSEVPPLDPRLEVVRPPERAALAATHHPGVGRHGTPVAGAVLLDVGGQHQVLLRRPWPLLYPTLSQHGGLPILLAGARRPAGGWWCMCVDSISIREEETRVLAVATEVAGRVAAASLRAAEALWCRSEAAGPCLAVGSSAVVPRRWSGIEAERGGEVAGPAVDRREERRRRARTRAGRERRGASRRSRHRTGDLRVAVTAWWDDIGRNRLWI